MLPMQDGAVRDQIFFIFPLNMKQLRNSIKSSLLLVVMSLQDVDDHTLKFPVRKLEPVIKTVFPLTPLLF